MSTSIQNDNSTFDLKARLRSSALRELAESPVILETHGGAGKLFLRCYRHVETGIVFEQKADKTSILARQRPTWSVYQADSSRALLDGAGGHLTVNFVDCDPYGEAWPVLAGFFESQRPRPARLVVVVNDGVRQGLKMNIAWHWESFAKVVERRGNESIYRDYAAVSKEMLVDLASKADYQLKRWKCYHCGHGQNMTHFAAVLERVRS